MVHRHRHLGAVHFRWGDKTWAGADSSHFCFAWCDRSRTWTNSMTFTNTVWGLARPEADVKFAKIRQ